MFGFASSRAGPQGPRFSTEDLKTIIGKALPSVKEQLGEEVYFTSDQTALVVESNLIASIRTELETETRNLTGESLATQLKVSRSTVQQLLPRAAEGLHDVYIDSVLILPKPRVDQLIEQIAAKENSILKVRDLSTQENLTIKSLDYIVRHSKGQLVLGGQGEYIVSASTLKSHVSRVKSELESASGPTKISSVESDAVLRALVMSELGLSSDTYIPQKYIETRLNAAISAMQEVGYISFTDLAASEVKDVAKFARQHSGIVLKDYVVSSFFYDQQKEKVSTALAEKRYFDLRDLPLGKRLADALVSDDKTKFSKYLKREIYPHHLVKPSLERDLTAKVTKALESDAQQAAAAIEIQASGATTAEVLLNKVKLPSSTDIASRFMQDLPEDLPVAAQIAPQVRGSYSAAALAVLKKRVEEAVEKLDAKILVYLNGLRTIQNEDLRAAVWDEWQQYVSDNEYSVPGSEQEATSQFQVNPDLVLATAAQLTASTEAKLAKLRKPKDAALALHYAVTVYHAHNFVPEKNGLLRIRGKVVPKLMKEFKFPESFEILRKSIKEPTSELLDQVKKNATKDE